MHIKGTPGTMQQDPYYDDVIDEIYNFLYAQAQKAIEAGIKAERIMIDPGIGFGKSIANNLNIIAKLNEFRNMGYPVMLGASRKSFIGHILDSAPASERLEGSLAAAVCGFLNGADILRVHDVKQTVKAVKIANRIKNYNV
jgi:dihydropteroate synthase